MSFLLLVILTILLGVYNWVPGPWRSMRASSPALPGPAAHNPGELIFCLMALILVAYASVHLFGQRTF